MTTIFLLLLTGLTQAAPAKCTEYCEERKAVTKLFNTVLSENSAFATERCERVPPLAWAQLYLMSTPITHRFSFNEACDVQGTVVIRKTPFNAALNIRDIDEYKHARARIALRLDQSDFMKGLIHMGVTVTNGQLTTGADQPASTAFNAVYDVTMNSKGRVVENKGGKVTITRYKGKPVHIEEPLLIE